MAEEFITRFGLSGEPGEIVDYGADDLPEHATLPPAGIKPQIKTSEFDDDVKPKIAVHQEILSRAMLYNGDTYDRERSNSYQIIKARGTIYGTGIVYYPMYKNYNWRGATFTLFYQYSSVALTQMQFMVQGFDPASSQWNTMLLSGPIIPDTSLLYTFKIYPGIATNPGFSSSDILPRFWRCAVVLGGISTTGYLFTIGTNLIV